MSESKGSVKKSTSECPASQSNCGAAGGGGAHFPWILQQYASTNIYVYIYIYIEREREISL